MNLKKWPMFGNAGHRVFADRSCVIWSILALVSVGFGDVYVCLVKVPFLSNNCSILSRERDNTDRLLERCAI